MNCAAQKTKKSIPRTVYPFKRYTEFLDYFKSLPEDCPWLFSYPRQRFSPKKSSVNNSPIIDPYDEWYKMLDLAGISDYHIHDLKAHATTRMLSEGCTGEDLIKLGAYKSRDMIDKCYYRVSAMDVVKRLNGEKGNCSPYQGSSVEKARIY